MCERKHTRNKIKKAYTILVCLSFIFIAGLRDPNMGMYDYSNGYLYAWRIVCNSNFKEIFGFIGYSDSALKDPGFAVYIKLLSFISHDENFFKFVVSIPYYITLCWFVYKYSYCYYMSYLVIYVMQYFTLTYYLLRPMMAIVFAILMIDAYINGKIGKSIVLFFVAVTMHFSAVALIGIYFEKLLNTKRKMLIIYLAAPFVGVFGNQVIKKMLALFIGNMRFAFYLQTDMAEGLSRYFISLAFALIVLVKYKEIVKYDNKNLIFARLMAFNSFFLGLTPIVADFWRIALYYGVASCIAFPNAFSKLSGNKKSLIGTVAVLLSLIYITFFLFPGTNAVPYRCLE